MRDALWNQIVAEVRQVIEHQGGFWDISWQLAALVEEIGELSRILQELQGIRSNVDKNEHSLISELHSEFGDVFFALICLAITLDVQLFDALELTIKKYGQRFRP